MENKKEYAVKPYSQEEIDRILGEIDEKLTEFIKSDKYKDVLLKMGNLGRYSFTNIIYILLQNPDATHVKGMKQWNYAGRSIKSGEKSIQIFAPIKETVMTEVVTEDGDPMLDEHGNKITKKREIVKGFKPCFVFGKYLRLSVAQQCRLRFCENVVLLDTGRKTDRRDRAFQRTVSG